MSCRRSFVAPSNDFELKAADFNIGYSTSDNSNNAVRTMANEVRNYSATKDKIGFAVSLCDRQRPKNESTTSNHIYTDKPVSQGDFVLSKKHLGEYSSSFSNSLAQNQHRATDFFIKRKYLFYSRGRYKRRLLQIVFATFLLVFAVSCKDEPMQPVPTDPNSLIGTSWQLIGIFDAGIDAPVTTPVYAEIWEYSAFTFDRWSFTLDFDSDTSVSGLTASNVMLGKYIVDSNSITFEIFTTLLAAMDQVSISYENGHTRNYYEKTLEGTDSFSIANGELKLFSYNLNTEERIYLLFKRKENLLSSPSFSSDPQENLLIETSWKLVGFYDTATDTLIKEPDLKGPSLDGAWPYTLNFRTDSTLSGETGFRLPGNLKYKIDFSTSALNFINFINRHGYDTFDENDAGLYIYLIRKVVSFSFTEEELKLFCNDQKTYLLFERREYE